MRRGVVFFLPLALAGIAFACSSFEEGEEGSADAGVEGAADVSSSSDASGPDVFDAVADADASNCACPGRAPCGVPLVSTKGAFCIDPHEVSEGAYAEFVTANLGKTLSGEAPCDSLVVTSRVQGDLDVPATRVTFCEARAYCTWAGKRLCGHVSGRALDGGSENADLEANAWLKACAGNGTPTILSGMCRKGLAPDAGPAKVGTTCEGSFPGVFDLQGNVWEWIDALSYNEAGTPGAFFLGGMWAGPTTAQCSTSGAFITSSLPDVGFRCCSP